MKADLHCHSNVSDGLLPPAEVAHRAADRGIQLWSLTDHDEVAGLADAHARADELGLTFVPGVEVSVTWAGATTPASMSSAWASTPRIPRWLPG